MAARLGEALLSSADLLLNIAAGAVCRPADVAIWLRVQVLEGGGGGRVAGVLS